jgi:hypothetical protein
VTAAGEWVGREWRRASLARRVAIVAGAGAVVAAIV